MSPSHSVADTCTDPGMVISSKYTREYGSGSPTSALVKCLNLGNGSERHGKEKGRLWDEDLIEVKERLLSILPNVGPPRHSILSSCGKGGYRNVNNVNKPLC